MIGCPLSCLGYERKVMCCTSKNKGFLLIPLLILAAFFLGRKSLNPGAAVHETAYDRVMRTQTLRCAYASYPPFIQKDPNTGAVSGLGPDWMAEFEKVSGLKVEWGPEVDFGMIAETLKSGKADAFCSGVALTPKRGHAMAGTVPLMYSVIAAFARKDDKRFDNNPDTIDSPDIKIAVNRGDLSEEVAIHAFPKAKLAYKGEMGGEAQLFMDVAAKKADVTLSPPSNISLYNKANPQMALRQIPFARPIMKIAGVITTEIHEQALINLLNASFQSMIDNGSMDKILRAKLGSDFGTSFVSARGATK